MNAEITSVCSIAVSSASFSERVGRVSAPNCVPPQKNQRTGVIPTREEYIPPPNVPLVAV